VTSRACGPRLVAASVVASALLVVPAGCKRKAEEGPGGVPIAGKKSIQNIGSDTMVNLAQAWAEAYATFDPSVSVEVSGGGSGIGIAALINGTADIANSSRKLEPEEEARAKKAGKDPREVIVGYDALAIYVHKSNPLQTISIDELGDIYRERGKIDKWSQLGVAGIPGGKGDDIVRVSRQNNSGTYHYFREAVLAKSDFKLGSLDMNGSKDVVELVSRTPNAIGYSGLGYATPGVKILEVSRKKGEPGVSPSIETVLDKTYPIARPLYLYTPGEAPPPVAKYEAWILSDAGQAIVKESGYVPLPKK
jgi:phosphate transport system substrate-binding protein